MAATANRRPRPDVPPETSRGSRWFAALTLEETVSLMLGPRLEQDDASLVPYLALPIGHVARVDIRDGAVTTST